MPSVREPTVDLRLLDVAALNDSFDFNSEGLAICSRNLVWECSTVSSLDSIQHDLKYQWLGGIGEVSMPNGSSQLCT